MSPLPYRATEDRSIGKRDDTYRLWQRRGAASGSCPKVALAIRPAGSYSYFRNDGHNPNNGPK